MCMAVSLHRCSVGSESNTWQVPNAGSYFVWRENPRRLQSKQCHETGHLMRSYFRNKQPASLSIEYSATVEAHVSHTHGPSTAHTRYISCRVTSVALSREKFFVFFLSLRLSVASTLLTQGMYLIQKKRVLSFPLTHILHCSLSAPHWLCWMNIHLSQQGHLLCWLVQNIPGCWIFFIYHFPSLVCQKVNYGHCPDLAHGHLS